MTTYTFTPSSTSLFSFQPTLDGKAYNIVVSWNLFGQRYYLNCYDLSGNLVFCLPLIGSPVTYPISITAGYFASTLVYYPGNQTFVVTP